VTTAQETIHWSGRSSRSTPTRPRRRRPCIGRECRSAKRQATPLRSKRRGSVLATGTRTRRGLPRPPSGS